MATQKTAKKIVTDLRFQLFCRKMYKELNQVKLSMRSCEKRKDNILRKQQDLTGLEILGLAAIRYQQNKDK